MDLTETMTKYGKDTEMQDQDHAIFQYIYLSMHKYVHLGWQARSLSLAVLLSYLCSLTRRE